MSSRNALSSSSMSLIRSALFAIMRVGSLSAKGSSSGSPALADEPLASAQRSVSVTRFSRSTARTACACSTHEGSPRSTTKKHASAVCKVPASHGSKCSGEIAGRSTSWKWMSSNGIMPGSGYWVVNGYGATCALDPVSRACSEDLPALGAPINAICPAPSGRSTRAGPPRAAPPLRGPSTSSERSLMRCLISACRWSVPLCLGMVRSISRSQCRRSRGSRALRNESSAAFLLGRKVGGHVDYAGQRPSAPGSNVRQKIKAGIIQSHLIARGVAAA